MVPHKLLEMLLLMVIGEACRSVSIAEVQKVFRIGGAAIR
jgi:hypothetical protein